MKDNASKGESRGTQRNAQRKTKRTTNQYDIFGDKIHSKKEGTLRIGIQNFNRFSGRDDDPTDQSLLEWINLNEFDVFGVPEINLCWPKVKKHLQFQERTHFWWQPGTTRNLYAFNKTEKHTKINSTTWWDRSAQPT